MSSLRYSIVFQFVYRISEKFFFTRMQPVNKNTKVLNVLKSDSSSTGKTEFLVEILNSRDI